MKDLRADERFRAGEALTKLTGHAGFEDASKGLSGVTLSLSLSLGV